MAKRVVIKALIRTKGPLSLTMPAPEAWHENEFKNFPVLTRGIDASGNRLRTGYLPATTVRGVLRRAATLERMRTAAAEGKPYKLPQIYNEMVGQDAQSEKKAEEIDLLAVQRMRDSSPVIDLFGTGLTVKSRLLVSHFYPATNVLPEEFTAVRKDLDASHDAVGMLQPEDARAFLNRTEHNRARAAAAALVKQLRRKIRRDAKNGGASEDDKQALEAALAKEAEAEGAMGEMKVSTRQIVRYFALPAEIELHGKLVIERPKARDLEVLEQGLLQLSLRPILGAQSARGCGEIEGVFEFADERGILIKEIAVGGYQEARVTNW